MHGEMEHFVRRPTLGLYVHIPFCLYRCPYCAFAVVVGRAELHERYVAAVCAELQQWRHLAARGPLHTVFIGGGTPSVLRPCHLQTILETAERVFGLHPDAEISLEANPHQSDTEAFAALRRLGFNRLSLGVQSFHDTDLQILGRRHTAAEAERAFHTARQAGFSNVNLDLMFSIPGVPRQRWRDTLRHLIALSPEHVSTYSLTIEEGASFAIHERRGKLRPVREADDAWAYAWAMETLTAAGYEQYEVSNFARPGYRCRHNWGYWQGTPYVGVGLSAHSFVDGRRSWNTCHLRTYLDAIEAAQSPCAGDEVIDPTTARRERIWLQLRTCDGVELEADEWETLRQQATVQGLLEAGRLRCHGTRLCLTPQGFLVADAIGAALVDLLERPVEAANRR